MRNPPPVFRAAGQLHAFAHWGLGEHVPQTKFNGQSAASAVNGAHNQGLRVDRPPIGKLDRGVEIRDAGNMRGLRDFAEQSGA